MYVLVTYKFYVDQIKSKGDSVETCFPITCVGQGELSVAMAITVLIESVPRTLKQPLLHPTDATYEI